MMPARSSTSQTTPAPFTPSHPGLLHRKCACGGSAGISGECESCKKKKLSGDSAPSLQTKLRVNAPGDRFEQEADQMADAVVQGAMASVAHAGTSRVQRDGPADDHTGPPTVAPKSDSDKLKEAAGKVAEALRATPEGKELEAKATKIGKDFVSTLEGKVVTGTILAGALAGIIATNSALPVQLPEIPLDFISSGLKGKLTWEGPVQKPTNAAITITTKSGVAVTGGYQSSAASPGKPAEQKVGIGVSIPLGGSSEPKKDKTSDSDKFRAETARIAEDQAKFREGMKSPADKAAEKADEKAFLDSYLRYKLNDPLNPLSLGGKKSPTDALPPLEPLKEKKDDDKAVQRKSSSNTHDEFDAPPLVNEVVHSAGQHLDAHTRAFMESRFGVDFSNVRIHADARSDESARAVNAHAYTVGSNVVFATGQFDPTTESGKRLLAHELTHVVQQGGAPQSASAHDASTFDPIAPHRAAQAVPAQASSSAVQREVASTGAGAHTPTVADASAPVPEGSGPGTDFVKQEIPPKKLSSSSI